MGASSSGPGHRADARPALRVALVAPPWLPVPPPAYGGTEEVVDRLAVGLRRLGVHVTLLAHPDSTCPVERPAVPAPPGRTIGDRPEEVRHAAAAFRVLAGRRVDLVHDHTLAGPAVAAGLGLADRLPLVVTAHGALDDHAAGWLRAAGDDVAVVAISQRQAALAREVRPTAVIHHGVDVEDHPLGRGDGGYALCLSRMSPDKGVDLAVLAARRAGVPLVIAAKMRGAEERAWFESAVRPLLGGDVRFVGEVDRATKRRLLAGAVALVNPIRWDEPFGMVMVEALACGTPVVSLANGAAPEIVRDGVVGYLCTDVDDLAGGLRAAARIDRATCRRWVAERFSTGRMARDHLRLYRSLLARRDHVVDLTAPGAAEPDRPGLALGAP